MRCLTRAPGRKVAHADNGEIEPEGAGEAFIKKPVAQGIEPTVEPRKRYEQVAEFIYRLQAAKVINRVFSLGIQRLEFTV